MKLINGLLVFAGIFSTGLSMNDQTLQKLETIFKSYDKSIRPNYDRNVPEVIEVTAHVLSMPEIDSVKQELVLNLYFRQGWNDSRLATHEETFNLPTEDWPKIWQPDTFFTNELAAEEHTVTTLNAHVKVHPDGRVQRSSRYTLHVSCPMNFQLFPFDEQICEVAIESYGHTAKAIVYTWKKNESSISVGKISHLEFQVIGTRLKEHRVTFQSGTYGSLTMEFLIRRNSGRYMSEFFYPCLFLTCVAILTMFAFEARLAVVVNALLMGFTILFLAIASGTMETPFVSYSTALDTFSSITNTYVFLCFLINVLVLILQKADAGPETFALSNLSQGRVRLTNDDEANLCSNATPTRQTQIPVGRIQAIFNIVANVLSRLLLLMKALLLLCYILTNIIYWSSYPNKDVSSNDDLIKNNWRVVD